MWQFLESFFENQARIKIERVMQLPPLHKAVKDGNISNIRIYLHRGCDINEQDVYGKTPLHYACEKNNIAIIKILLQSPKIKVAIKDNEEHIPLDLLTSINLKIEIHLEDNVDKLGKTVHYDTYD